MNRHQLIGILALVAGAFGTGCVGHAHASGSAEAEAPVVFVGTPTLVAIDSGVWVVRGSDRPVYFVENEYWVIRDGKWYRSRTYDGGWAVVEVAMVPSVIVKRDHTTYVNYKGEATAATKPAPRNTEVTSAQTPAKSGPPAVGNPHGGPPGHDDTPGVGNQRKADGEQPGRAPGEPAKADPSPGKNEPGMKADGVPGVGNQRKAEGTQPGEVGHGVAPAAKPKPADQKADPKPTPPKKDKDKDKDPPKKK